MRCTKAINIFVFSRTANYEQLKLIVSLGCVALAKELNVTAVDIDCCFSVAVTLLARKESATK